MFILTLIYLQTTTDLCPVFSSEGFYTCSVPRHSVTIFNSYGSLSSYIYLQLLAFLREVTWQRRLLLHRVFADLFWGLCLAVTVVWPTSAAAQTEALYLTVSHITLELSCVCEEPADTVMTLSEPLH